MSCLLIPAIPGTAAEVRGNGELFPLNGPSWSLFFEYIGNIMYALFLRRLSDKWLQTVVAVSGAGYAAVAVFNGSGYYNMGVGWSLSDLNFLGGMLRLTFSFSAGLLLSRNFRPVSIKGAFWICSFLIIILLSIPYITIGGNGWTNGIYDSFCTLVVFPIIVWLGASGSEMSSHCIRRSLSENICKFLGDISYPLYIIHYPIMYLFYAWVWKDGLSFSQVWPVAAAIFIGSIALAYACLKFYDLPIRKWLSRICRTA